MSDYVAQMGGTKPKSIFDIPKVQSDVVVPAPPKRKRRIKSRKVKKPKTARAGGVEVSQKTNVRGQKQITLKHKGGLTQEITIHTGDSKPRGAQAKGQQVSWNMKPAKFKASRGLRDDRVYLQPPKREYFGNRYKSAIDQIKIEQKVKEAGASKNKEIADVRDTANREKRELERRERVKEDTISELKKERAGLVASYNVSQRNQSKATILGGDVGELNKLINRRGYGAIRNLVIKGEITDASTIYQLNLSAGQIDKLIKTLEGERGDFTKGTSVIYLTERGDIEDGKVLNETEKFVNLERGKDGVIVRVPKSNIQKPKAVAVARAKSRDPSVQRGESVPPAQLFTGVSASEDREPRERGTSSEDERPEWRQSARRRDVAPRDVRKPRFSEEPEFVGGGSEELVERYTQNARRYHSESLPRSQNKTPREYFEGLITKQKSAPADLEEALRGAEEASPPAGVRTIDELVAEQELSGITEATEEFSGREDAPSASDLELILEEEPEEVALPSAATRRAAFLEGESGGGSVRALQSASGLLGNPKLIALRRASRERSRSVERDDATLTALGKFQRSQLLGGYGGLGDILVDREPKPEPEPELAGGSSGGAPMGQIQYAIPTDIKTRLGERDKFKVVDNRQESALGKGRQRRYPVITLNYSELKAVIESETKGKQKQNLLRKLNEQRDGNRSLFTNNDKLLRKIFGA
jgi:hypothetical protein